MEGLPGTNERDGSEEVSRIAREVFSLRVDGVSMLEPGDVFPLGGGIVEGELQVLVCDPSARLDVLKISLILARGDVGWSLLNVAGRPAGLSGLLPAGYPLLLGGEVAKRDIVSWQVGSNSYFLFDLKDGEMYWVSGYMHPEHGFLYYLNTYRPKVVDIGALDGLRLDQVQQAFLGEAGMSGADAKGILTPGRGGCFVFPNDEQSPARRAEQTLANMSWGRQGVSRPEGFMEGAKFPMVVDPLVWFLSGGSYCCGLPKRINGKVSYIFGPRIYVARTAPSPFPQVGDTL